MHNGIFKSYESVDDWFENATDNYRILPKDVEHARTLINDKDVDREFLVNCDQNILCNLNRTNRFIGRDLKMISKLNEYLYLCRSFINRIPNDALFVVIDSRNPEKIVTEFKWSLQFLWSNFGVCRPLGCFYSEKWVTFHCAVSCNRNYVVIVGPAEESGVNRRQSVPSTKILYCDTWKIENLHIDCFLGWPAQILFDLDPENEEIVHIIYHSFPSIVPMRYKNYCGKVMQYDLKKKNVKRWAHEVDEVTLLQFIHNGRYLVTVQCQDSILNSISLLESSDYNVLLNIQGRDFESCECEIDMYLFAQLAIYYSADFQYLSLVSWENNQSDEVIMSNVQTYDISKCRPFVSLKALCRGSLLKHVKYRNLCRLILPASLMLYIEGYE